MALAAKPGAHVPLTSRDLEALVAIETHWTTYCCAPSRARLEAFLGRPAQVLRLQTRGLVSWQELRLTGRGAAQLYRLWRLGRSRRRRAA